MRVTGCAGRIGTQASEAEQTILQPIKECVLLTSCALQLRAIPMFTIPLRLLGQVGIANGA